MTFYAVQINYEVIDSNIVSVAFLGAFYIKESDLFTLFRNFYRLVFDSINCL